MTNEIANRNINTLNWGSCFAILYNVCTSAVVATIIEFDCLDMPSSVQENRWVSSDVCSINEFIGGNAANCIFGNLLIGKFGVFRWILLRDDNSVHFWHFQGFTHKHTAITSKMVFWLPKNFGDVNVSCGFCHENYTPRWFVIGNCF